MHYWAKAGGKNLQYLLIIMKERGNCEIVGRVCVHVCEGEREREMGAGQGGVAEDRKNYSKMENLTF